LQGFMRNIKQHNSIFSVFVKSMQGDLNYNYKMIPSEALWLNFSMA
jgi:hypothetical protein